MRLGMLAPWPGGGLALALAEHRLDAGDLAPHLAEPRRVFELPAGPLKAQVEALLAERLDLLVELVRGPGSQIGRFHRLHAEPSSPGRTTKRVATGNFAAASSNASRAMS